MILAPPCNAAGGGPSTRGMMMKSWCVFALVLGGCGAEGAEEVGWVSAQVGGSDCDRLNCPGNSGLMGVLRPYELDRTGLQLSSRRMRLAGLEFGDVGIDLANFGVSGTSIHVQTAAKVLTGAGVVGLKLILAHEPENQPPQTYELYIEDYTRVPYYVDGGDGAFWGYHIVYGLPGQEVLQELCPYQEYDPDHEVAATWAVFWQGDRYDPDTGQIFASGEQVGPWFNLSCAGEATIKMLRTRTGGAVDPASPVAQRQATLNMFTAAYCGPGGPRITKYGVPFTTLGQPIAWSDLSGPQEIEEGGVSSYEAAWDEHGAVCLRTPRKAGVKAKDVLCSNKQPKMIPSCTAADIESWQAEGWLLSGTPLPGP